MSYLRPPPTTPLEVLLNSFFYKLQEKRSAEKTLVQAEQHVAEYKRLVAEPDEMLALLRNAIVAMGGAEQLLEIEETKE